MNIFVPDKRPRLSRHVRLHTDKVSGAPVLLLADLKGYFDTIPHILVCRVVVHASVLPCSGRFRKGDRRLSQVSREPFRTFAPLSDPGRTIALGF